MEKLTIEQFGAELLRSQDLDPVYVMIHKAWEQRLLTWDELCQWCLMYWCCYHVGVASYWAKAEAPEFALGLLDVASNVSRVWPRGAERRHFRARNALNLCAGLSPYSTATDFITNVMGPSPRTFSQVAKRVQKHPGFGPWIAFKIADMGERVLSYPIDFKDCLLGVYKEPVNGARMACTKWYPPQGMGSYTDQDCLRIAVNRLMETFGDELAPPDYKRFVGIAEIETILCKWKSHMLGHYPLGKDTLEIKHALQGFGDLADQLSEFVPTGNRLREAA